MHHLDEGTIHAWLDGALDAEEAARVERHAAECASCGAAVAEARGLVAGASRILSALDDVPAGVVPRTAPLAGGSAPRRPRALWQVLHFTPARAAAAAVIVLAAGTMLVIRAKPNELRRGASMTAAGAPVAADTTAHAQVLASPTIVGAPVSGAPPMASAERGVAQNRVRATRKTAESPRPTDVASALSAPTPAISQTPPASAEARELRAPAAKVATFDSVSAHRLDRSFQDSGVARARRATQLSDVVTTSAVAGGAAGKAVAPAPRAQAQLVTTQRPSLPFAGCYLLLADTSGAVPEPLSLDSARVDVDSTRRAAFNAQVLDDRHSMSAIVGNERHHIADAFWRVLLDGNIELYFGGQPPRALLALPKSPSELSGSMLVAGRSVHVTLRRVDCRGQ